MTIQEFKEWLINNRGRMFQVCFYNRNNDLRLMNCTFNGDDISKIVDRVIVNSNGQTKSFNINSIYYVNLFDGRERLKVV